MKLPIVSESNIADLIDKVGTRIDPAFRFILELFKLRILAFLCLLWYVVPTYGTYHFDTHLYGTGTGTRRICLLVSGVPWYGVRLAPTLFNPGPNFFSFRICNENFSHRNKLIYHMSKDHVKAEMPYCCQVPYLPTLPR